MQTRKTSFVTPIAHHIRRRHEHIRSGKQVVSFSVQLELFHGGKWSPVVRYDTAHGYAHRDLIRPDGGIDKTPLFLRTLSEALAFAEADLRSNWQSYITQYLKEVSQ